MLINRWRSPLRPLFLLLSGRETFSNPLWGLIVQSVGQFACGMRETMFSSSGIAMTFRWIPLAANE